MISEIILFSLVVIFIAIFYKSYSIFKKKIDIQTEENTVLNNKIIELNDLYNNSKKDHINLLSINEEIKLSNNDLSSKYDELLQQKNELQSNLAVKYSELKNSQNYIDNLESKLKDCEKKIIEITNFNNHLNVIKAELETKLKSADILKQELEDATKDLTKELFENNRMHITNLSESILKKSNEKLNDSCENIMLKPFKQELEIFKNQVIKLNSDLERRDGVFDNTIKNLKEDTIAGLQQQTVAVKDAVTNLNRVLKQDNKAVGDWGEVVLQIVLEKCGLINGMHFRMQETIEAGDKKLRPDCILNLPNNKEVVIDSKVSIKSYMEYLNQINVGDSKEVHINWLDSFKKSIKNHFKALKDKDYQRYTKGENTLQYVIMFIPFDDAFMLINKECFELQEESLKSKIIIASPGLLIGMLKVIEQMWSVEKQQKNMQDTWLRIRNLSKKLNSFFESLRMVGNGLQTASINYGKAVKQLSDGQGNAFAIMDSLIEDKIFDTNDNIIKFKEKSVAIDNQDITV